MAPPLTLSFKVFSMNSTISTPSFPEQYTAAWHSVTQVIREQWVELATLAGRPNTTNLHDVLCATVELPYQQAKLMCVEGSGPSNLNIGSMTGFFFEQLVSAAVVGHVRTRLPAAHRVERNACSTPAIRKVARDPDLVITLGERSAVIEVKTAPKKRDLDAMRGLRTRYAELGVLYLCVGGYATFNAGDWRQLVEERWMSVCSGGTTGAAFLDQLPRLDDLLGMAVGFLSER